MTDSALSSNDPSPLADDDDQTTVNQLKVVVERFVEQRSWQEFHNPKNLVMSLAIETAELMEHFQWLTPDESLAIMDDAERAHAVGEEVADCLAYLLAIASKLDIDLSTTLRAKMVRNAVKYPVSPNSGSTEP